MADKKITELTTYSPPVDNDVLPIVDTTLGVTMKITWANIKAALKTYFDSLTTTLTNKTLTSPVLNTSFTGTAKATGAEINTGTEDAKIVTPKAIADSWLNNGYNSIARQAIINGNFDVWQRGVSFLSPNGVYTVDRWKAQNAVDTQLKVLQSSDVPNSKSIYSCRLEEYSGTGGTNAFTDFLQPIENYKFFAGQVATLSFWAKCDSGVTVTAKIEDNVSSNSISVDNTSWTKYVVTYTVNASATLLDPAFRFNRSGLAVGKGFNITQVQLCAGDVALPFMPKSFEEELRACMRYYEKSWNYGVAEYTATTAGYEHQYALAATANAGRYTTVHYSVPKRNAVVPIICPYTTPTNTSRVSDSTGTDLGANSGVPLSYNERGFSAWNNSGGTLTTGGGIIFHWIANAEL